MQTFSDLIKFGVSAGVSALVGKRVLYCLWELTYRCNAKCEICDYWRTPSTPETEMKLAKIQEGLQKVYAYGCRAVNFTGGEPTLRPDLENIIRYASGLRMWTSMVTNGSRLTRERVGALKKAGLDNLLISLDSMTPALHDRHRGIDGLHAKVMDCLQWLSADFLTGHRTGGIMCVLTRMNFQHISEIIKFADERGVFVVIQPYHDNKTGNKSFHSDINDSDIDRILRTKNERKNLLCSESYLRGFTRFYQNNGQPQCHAGLKHFSIDPYGNLSPCVDMPPAGHLLKDDISVVRSTEALQDVNSCQGCWYSFRGESDTTLSYQGCLEKLRLGLSVIAKNKKRKRAVES
ncbi:MAG: radical SAM/SPASM domain-containing protein [bacterium]